MKQVQLNRPALWRPIRSFDTSVRKYAGAYPYQTKSGIITYSSPQRPVYRYAKNHSKFKQQFSLFIFTDETNLASIEEYFESLVKNLKKAEIMEAVQTASASSFKYLDTFYGDNE